MATLPPVIFEVNLVAPAEMRWALRAKGVIDDWLLSDAAGERPVASCRRPACRCRSTPRSARSAPGP